MAIRALFVALTIAATIPASANDNSEALLRSHAELQQRDRQLLDVGWRLATANAPYCSDARPAIGLLLQDMRGYGKHSERLRRALNLQGDIAVQAVADNSPAASAGLKANTEIIAIGDQDPNGNALGDESSWKRLADLHGKIAAELAQAGHISVRLRGVNGAVGDVTIDGVPACPSRFEVLDSGKKAMAEGERVIFGREFPGFDYSEDEFAAAVAHELAHNLLGHRAWLAENGRKRSNVRLTEREADRLMPWLLANAGYGPRAASRFMQRWGPAHGGWIFRKRTHDGWDERTAIIATEIEWLEQVRDGDGRADWATHFKREVEP